MSDDLAQENAAARAWGDQMLCHYRSRVNEMVAQYRHYARSGVDSTDNVFALSLHLVDHLQEHQTSLLAALLLKLLCESDYRASETLEEMA